MPRTIRSVITLASTILLAVTGSAAADQIENGVFRVVPDMPGVVEMNGPVIYTTALNFRQILTQVENPRLLILNSDGGQVEQALEIADEVHQRGMSTLIRSGGGCYSACSYIFFAGKYRRAEGRLGVHQIAGPNATLDDAQKWISAIIERLDSYGTPTPVITTMFRTSASTMHTFTAEEIAQLGINRGSEMQIAEMLNSKRYALETDITKSQTDDRPRPQLYPRSGINAFGRSLFGGY